MKSLEECTKDVMVFCASCTKKFSYIAADAKKCILSSVGFRVAAEYVYKYIGIKKRTTLRSSLFHLRLNKWH